MGAAVTALFEAARLSSWGLGLLLVYLAYERGWNEWQWALAGKRIGRWVIPAPAKRFDPPRATGGNPTTVFAAARSERRGIAAMAIGTMMAAGAHLFEGRETSVVACRRYNSRPAHR